MHLTASVIMLMILETDEPNWTAARNSHSLRITLSLDEGLSMRLSNCSTSSFYFSSSFFFLFSFYSLSSSFFFFSPHASSANLKKYESRPLRIIWDHPRNLRRGQERKSPEL